MQDFANMSAALTGFQPSFIRPFLDPVNLSGTFYQFAVSQVGQTMMDALLSAFDALSKQTSTAVSAANRRHAARGIERHSVASGATLPEHRGYVVSGIVVSATVPDRRVCSQVISSQAYTKSLAWNLAQAHPMGFSAFTFGYWSQPPASLETFGVNTGNGGGQ